MYTHINTLLYIGSYTFTCECKCSVIRHVHVCVALPIVVGAWPMAGKLWQLFEYYYYIIITISVLPCQKDFKVQSLSLWLESHFVYV